MSARFRINASAIAKIYLATIHANVPKGTIGDPYTRNGCVKPHTPDTGKSSPNITRTNLITQYSHGSTSKEHANKKNNLLHRQIGFNFNLAHTFQLNLYLF